METNMRESRFCPRITRMEEIRNAKPDFSHEFAPVRRSRPRASSCNNSLVLSNWRGSSSQGNDLASGEVVKVPWIGGVMARVIRIGIVVEHCVQAKVVQIRKRKARASVKKMVGRKVVEEDAAVSVIGIEPILVA